MVEKGNITQIEDYQIIEEPYYEPVGKEIELFEIAYHNKNPLALVGPTGCGKTQLTSYMAWKLRQDLISRNGDKITISEISKSEKQQNGNIAFPYIEIPCHEDITETHLLGRYDLNDNWMAGPLYIGATQGGIVVLDEIIEARKDAIVLLHGLTDDRRVLSVSKKREIIEPPDNFMIVACYNPGYQVRNKDLKPSTKQRFPTIDMDYAPEDLETKILIKKTGIEEDIAKKIVCIGSEIRKAKDNASLKIQEGASTRLLVRAAEFYQTAKSRDIDLSLEEIVRVNIFNPISTEETDKEVLNETLKYLL